MSTSSKTAASTEGSIFLRRIHLTATCRPVARWTPRQTVEKVPLLSYTPPDREFVSLKVEELEWI